MKIRCCLVRWVDSQAGPGWRRRKDAEEWANLPGGEHLSIGFELPIGPDGDVVLAQTIQLAKAGNVGELLQIPKSAIRSVKTLSWIDEP